MTSSVLITVSGRDRPGVTGALFTVLATHDVDAMIEFGFRNLISGIERLVAGEEVGKKR